MGEQLYTKQGITTREKLTRLGRKRVPSGIGKRKEKKKDWLGWSGLDINKISEKKRISTDDIIDVSKNIAISVAACAGVIGALRKIGNILGKGGRTASANLDLFLQDARQQIRHSLDTIEIAIKRSKTTFWGKRRREPYGPYGKNKPKYKFRVGTPDEED